MPEAATQGFPWKKDVLKNFAKFIGKYQCQSLLSNKVAAAFCTEQLQFTASEMETLQKRSERNRLSLL